mgnify:CR=1 FL=1
MDKIEYPFFRYFLEGKGEKPKHKVNIFHTGENEWKTYDEWPVQKTAGTPYYIHNYCRLPNSLRKRDSLQSPDNKIRKSS